MDGDGDTDKLIDQDVGLNQEPNPLFVLPEKRLPDSSHPQEKPNKIPRNIDLQSPFSTTSAISSFMQVRGRSTSIQSPMPKESTLPVLLHTTNEKTSTRTENNKGTMQVPTIPSPETAREGCKAELPAQSSKAHPIIANTSLLKSYRSLLNRLEDVCQMVVFRDFPTTSAAPDLIFSPVTCVVLTTLQIAQQRSLPGSKAGTARTGPLQERIVDLSTFYDQIFILILTLAAENADIDAQSCAILGDLSAFSTARASCCHIQSILIPPMSPTTEAIAGGPYFRLDLHHHLLEWIVVLIRKHGYGIGSEEQHPVRLLHEETQWEMWLRQAGLNPYAAQATIMTLNQMDHDGSSLRTLMNMSEMERAGCLRGTIGEKALGLLNVRLGL